MSKFIDAGSSGEWGWHATELALKCPQAFAYNYRVKWSEAEGDELPVRPSRSRDALLKGSLVHQGIAHLYARLRDGDDAWADPYEAIEWAAAKLGEGADKFVALAQSAVRAYESEYAMDTLEPLHVEEVFTAEIHGYKFTQRFDLVARDAAGRVLILDHKCLPLGAVVLTSDGEKTVAQLIAEGSSWDAAACDTTSRTIHWKAASVPAPAGVQDVWEVKTKGGFGGPFGYKHPILTPHGWVRACDLRAGDKVAVGLKVPPASRQMSVSDAAIRMIGSMICDGGLKGLSPMYTKKSEKKLESFVQDLSLMGMADGTDYVLRRPAGKTPYVMLRAHSAAVCLLRSLGLMGRGSADKRIPRPMLSMSKEQTQVFLGALWSGDGHMGIRKSGSARIVYASRSRGLCEDIQKLLARVGVFSTVTDSSVAYKGSRRGYYFTTVVGSESKRRFVSLALDGTMPVLGVGEDLLSDMLVSCCDGGHDKLPVEGDIAWDTVSSNVFTGKEPCYDIEVEELHTFVAGGLVTHNTTSMLSASTASRYTLSGQFLGMANFGRSVWGKEFGGVVINLVEFRSSGFGFKRVPVEPAPNAQRLFPLTVKHARDRIAALDASGADPMEWPKVLSETVCVSSYGNCEWWNVCKWGT